MILILGRGGQLGTSFASLLGPGARTLGMDELDLQPRDHDPDWKSQGPFNPKRHNWRRRHKVPSLVLNATTMNTGHCWQFTTSSMGESPSPTR